MYAIGLTEFDGPEVLRVVELPDPVPGRGEVRIRVHTAAASPTDTMLRAGTVRTLFDGRPARMCRAWTPRASSTRSAWTPIPRCGREIQ